MTKAPMKLALLAVCAASVTLSASDWPAWRGPNGTSTTASRRTAPCPSSQASTRSAISRQACSGAADARWTFMPE